MKIFICYSRQKELFVEKFIENLDKRIKVWIDERNIVIGENIPNAISKAIKEECDFLIAIIDEHAVKSPWVRKEYKLARERENRLKRDFLLPVVLDEKAWDEINDSQFKKKNYLTCMEPNKSSAIKQTAEDLNSHLLEILIRSFDVKRKSKANFPQHKRDYLEGTWLSWWTSTKNGNKKYETLELEQDGYDLRGTASRDKEPKKKWDVVGRYDGNFLQMYWYPSPDSQEDPDPLDYGCYFLEREKLGNFSGRSVSYRKKGRTGGKILSDYHYWQRLTKKKKQKKLI